VGVDGLHVPAVELLWPALAAQARTGVLISGTRPSTSGRMRRAAWWIVSPSGIARPA